MSSNAVHLENGAPEPEPKPASDPDLDSNDTGIHHTDVQSPDAEENSKIDDVIESNTLKSVHAERSNSGPKEISILPSVTSESEGKEVKTNDAGSEPNLKQEEENRTFTMRELLNELKNGDVNEGVDTPQRSVSFF